MHLIRLLLSRVTVLRHGFVPLGMEEYRVRLLAIRAGQADWDQVEEWRLALHRELEDALAATALPEYPVTSARISFSFERAGWLLRSSTAGD